MTELNEYLNGISAVETKLKSGKTIKFQDMCSPLPGGVGCRFMSSPLDFAMSRKGIDLTQFADDS